MGSTYRSFQGMGVGRGHAARQYGLTDPGVIEAYVNRRVEDPSLLAGGTGPSYADFFRGVAA